MNDTGGPVRGVVLTHGEMCHGLVDAVRKITGMDGDALVAVSNEGHGPEALALAVDEVAGAHPAIVFADLQTGSCAFAARLACRSAGARRVIFGTNLPMLLDFIFHRDLPLDELVERLLERGRAGIRTLERTEAGADRPLPGG